MKALLFRVPESGEGSFRVQVDHQPFFYDTLHFHPEIQITVFLEGSGTQFVGDHIGTFEAGDVIVLGPNLPHVFRCDEPYYQENSGLMAHSVSLFLKKESFGERFFDLPEMKKISQLLSKSSRGIKLKGKGAQNIGNMISEMVQQEGFDRFTGLLFILDRLTKVKKSEVLSSVAYSTPQKESDNKKINDVFQFVMLNYHRELRLEEVASVAHMSPTAFCRYFKLRTRKTFSRFLNEIRVGQACKLLVEQDSHITSVCYASGFNNISNFNRQFKQITGYTPSGYKQRYN